MSDWTYESDLRAARAIETELRATVKRLRAERDEARRAKVMSDAAAFNAARQNSERLQAENERLQAENIRLDEALRVEKELLAHADAERDRLREATAKLIRKLDGNGFQDLVSKELRAATTTKEPADV